MRKQFILLIIICVLFSTRSHSQLVIPENQVISDHFVPLSPNSIHFDGYFENDIQNSIDHWNKGVLPYSEFVQFFRTGRPQFSLGEMWGKAVRSGCIFYRYTQDPDLKRILQTTMADIFN